jgi:hypothetical protein
MDHRADATRATPAAAGLLIQPKVQTANESAWAG